MGELYGGTRTWLPTRIKNRHLVVTEHNVQGERVGQLMLARHKLCLAHDSCQSSALSLQVVVRSQIQRGSMS